jgi:molecular chaperone DnaJ
MEKRCYYEILEVTKTSSGGEIKKAYRKKAMEFHPDRNPGNAEAEEKFKEASEAYEVLSSQEKKQMYDQFGHQGMNGQGFGGFSSTDDIFSSFGSIFDDFFGFGGAGPGSRSRGRRGADLRYDLTLEFTEACFGVSKDIEFEREESCGTCHGSRAEEGGKKTCQTCGGVGQVRRSQGFFSVASACPTCHGEGEIITKPCKACHGQGVLRKKKKVNVKIPAGVEHGIRLRVSGEGQGGSGGAPAGDLYVFLQVEDSEHFERETDDLVYHLEVGIAQAALGCRLKIPSIEDHEIDVEIPPGSQYGQRITIANQGIPRLRGVGRGDLFVELSIQIPTKLSTEQRDLLEKFAEISDQTVKHKATGIFHKIFGV